MTAPARQEAELGLLVEQIKDRISLVELATEVIPGLRRVGASFRGPCPFHQGTHLNFDVSPARNRFRCFVCGMWGDAIEFVRKHPAFGAPSFDEALRYLADRAGVELPQTRGLRGAEAEAFRQSRGYVEHALDVALRTFTHPKIAARYATEIGAVRDAEGIPSALWSRAGAGFNPGDVLLSTVLALGLDGENWKALRLLGLLEFAGEPGSAEAGDTLREVLPRGPIWPITARGRTVGLLAWPARDAPWVMTRRAYHLNPEQGVLRVAPSSAAFGAQRDVAIWASLADWRHAGAESPYAGIVPLSAWNTSTGIQRMIGEAKGDTPIGMLGADGTIAFWCDPLRLSWIEQVAEASTEWSRPRPHPCEWAFAHDPAVDLLSVISRVPDDAVRLALTGWLATQAPTTATAPA
jgi:hypothetical protein